MTQGATSITPMQEARAFLSSSVTTLHERVSELERRIETVRRPSAPKPSDQEQKVTEMPSEHRGFLNEHALGVIRAVERLDDLLRRIEL